MNSHDRRRSDRCRHTDRTFHPLAHAANRLPAWRHPWLVVLVTLFGLPLLLEDAHWLIHFNEGTPQLLIMLVQIAGAVTLCMRPLIGSYLVIAAMLAAELTSYVTSSSALFILFLALAVAGYTSFPEGTALTCVAVAGHAIASVLYSGELWSNNLLIYVLECAFCCCLGMALRWKQDRDAHIEAERTLLRDLTVARRLHDYACNEISNTMLLLDELQPHAGQEQELALARRLSSNALGHVRAAIGTLEQTQSTQEVVPSPDTGNRIREYVSEQASVLSALGFEGTVIIADELHIPENNADTLRGLIRELFGNIAKHADKDFGYTITITSDDRNLSIMQCDRPQPDRPTGTTAERQGTGLRRYRSMVNRLGGQWAQQYDGLLWTLDIQIPLNTTHAGATRPGAAARIERSIDDEA